jgi:glycosyltransferase involved in cell wall biosynthesis
MKNICIFLDVEFGSGGTFQYNQQLLQSLIEIGNQDFKIHAYYIDPTWETIIPDNIFKRRLKYNPLLKQFCKILFMIGAPFSVMRFLLSKLALGEIRSKNFDIVFFPSQDLVGLFLSDHSVSVIHDLMHRYENRFKESSGWGRSRFRDRLYKSMGEVSEFVLVDSECGKRQLMESYQTDPVKIEVLPYVAPNHIVKYQDSPESIEYFKQLNLPTKFFFYPAQFWPHKNHQILLQASTLLKSKIPDLHLVFTGPPKFDYLKLKEFVKANKLEQNVTFLNYVPNEMLGGFYLRARALVMPTFYGPTNIPPLEAIALGCPVAVSRIYGMEEQLGSAALYFDNQNVPEVTNVLKILWTDDNQCEILKKNAKEHFATWNHSTFTQTLSNIINRNFLNRR